ncbi:CvpA family protein [Stieleria sp. JC731]|uniref:CvpA family protein n=2 Tax=Pirellulaceae TaxID=2691357 RepID=UPI003A4C5ADA|nr:CvpA family protein [Stieleria sp. JC731]
MNPWLMIVITMATMAGAFYFFRQGDIVTAICLVAISLMSMVAFKMGIIGIASSLLGLGAAVYLAPLATPYLEPYGTQYFQSTGLANRFLCIGISGILISMLVSMLVATVLGQLIARRQWLAQVNHYGGFLLGAIEGTVMVWLVLGGLISIQMWQRGADLKNNAVAAWVDQWASRTRQSTVGPIVRDYNPFEKIEPLAETQKFPVAVREFTSPGGLDRLLTAPEVQALQNNAEVSKAVRELQNDPKLAAVLQGGQPVQQETLIYLMNSPAVMKLADNPEFREQVKRVIDARMNSFDPFQPSMPAAPEMIRHERSQDY